ncbi:MAG: XdhC family protein [Vulcanimicrobiaceae bacterium]
MDEPYALAIVVRRQAPVSSHAGDRAVIHADGRMEGFIGGSCSRDIIRREGLRALQTGKPRLVRIRPRSSLDEERAAGDDPETMYVPMSCASEGAVDVYVEPHLPKRPFIVTGFTPVAQALARLGAALDYDLVHFVEAGELADAIGVASARTLALDELAPYLRDLDQARRSRAIAIVASQGCYDESALAELLRYELGFVGLLASRKRAANVAGILAQQGVLAGRIASIHSPVGLDIGARTPGDVAVSILAEVVAVASQPAQPEAMQSPRAYAVDPVCGMEVETTTAHRAERDSRRYYFCCGHCRATFVADPDTYTVSAGQS